MVKTLDQLASTEIGSLVHRKISVFKPEDTAGSVLGELEKTGRYEAVVYTGSKIGLITIRDLLHVEQPEQTKIERLWKPQSAVTADSQVGGVASELVRLNMRALPVIEKKDPVGIISQTDIVAEMADIPELKKTPIREIARIPAVTLDAKEKIAQAVKAMLDGGFSHVPVTSKGRIVGLVTAQEIVHTFISLGGRTMRGERYGEKASRFTGAVSGVMDRNPFILGPEASAFDVANGLRDQEKSVCVIVDEEQAVLGVVTPRELLPLVAGPAPEEELPVYIMGLEGEDFFEKELAEAKVRRVIQKSIRMHPEITEASARIKKQSPAGERVRYEVTARVISPREQWNAKADGWDLVAVFDEAVRELENSLKKAKEREGKLRRGPAREQEP